MVDLLTINDEFRLKRNEVLEVDKSKLETIAKDVALLKGNIINKG